MNIDIKLAAELLRKRCHKMFYGLKYLNKDFPPSQKPFQTFKLVQSDLELMLLFTLHKILLPSTSVK